MARTPIQPNSDHHAPVSYREKMSWTVRKEDLHEALQYEDGECKDVGLFLYLKRTIPGSFQLSSEENNMMPPGTGWPAPYPGGIVRILKKGISLETDWPKGTDLDLLHIRVEYKLKTTDGKCIVDVKGETVKEVVDCIGGVKSLDFLRLVRINADRLYDEDGSFIVEADILIEKNLFEAENSSFKESNAYGEEIKSILNDEKNSDVLVIAGDREFKCHKNILGARSEVFKNTVAHNTVESNTNTIVIKESPAQTVEDMLKYIYSGDVPKDSKSLTTELLHIASMYQLQPVVEACLKNLVESLDVASCVSTFMLVDRYVPQDRNMRGLVIMFMQCKAMEMIEEEDWYKLMSSHSDLAKEILKAMVKTTKEKHRCQFCVVTYN